MESKIPRTNNIAWSDVVVLRSHQAYEYWYIVQRVASRVAFWAL